MRGRDPSTLRYAELTFAMTICSRSVPYGRGDASPRVPVVRSCRGSTAMTPPFPSCHGLCREDGCLPRARRTGRNGGLTNVIGRTQISRGEDRVATRLSFKFRCRLPCVMPRSEPDSLGSGRPRETRKLSSIRRAAPWGKRRRVDLRRNRHTFVKFISIATQDNSQRRSAVPLVRRLRRMRSRCNDAA